MIRQGKMGWGPPILMDSNGYVISMTTFLKWMLIFTTLMIFKGCSTCSKHGADACVGSRYVPGGKIINCPNLDIGFPTMHHYMSDLY